MTHRSAHPRSLPRFPAPSILTVLLVLFFGSTGWASPYELRFCAPVNSWPSADKERGGFDIEIAQLIADDLGAEASFEWTQFNDVGVRDTLHAGLCDLMVGMGEGVAGTSSSVAYLRTPYVFVTHEDRDLTIESLDDPILEELAIGTYQFGTPTIALRNRGLDNRVEFAAYVTEDGVDAHAPILDAVLDGSVDVGIVYGPEASIRIVEGAPLTIEQVRPEIDFGESIIQLSRIWTIAVRPHDEAMRDRVNGVLARRWDDVQDILARYRVPTLDLPRPTEGTPIPLDALRIGIVHPSRTPAQVPGFQVGEAARLATQVAENRLAQIEALGDRVRLYEASAPTAASTIRAAHGLVLADHVDVIIGGYDGAQALGLAELATEHDVVFLNAGAEHTSLRRPACYPTTVHVAPDVLGYVRAIVSSGLGLDPSPAQWFAVVETPYAGEARLDGLAATVAAAGGSLVGSTVVETGQFLYFDTLNAIEEAAPDAVLLLMNEDQQELFMSQAAGTEPTWAVTGLPTLRSQTRAFLQRFLQVSSSLMRTPRIAVWDPALDNDLNDRYSSRTADAMGGAAWTTYAAFVLAFDASEMGVGRGADELMGAWTGRDDLNVGKAEPAFVRAAELQLASTLYLVEPVPDAPWGRTPTEKTATARIVRAVDASVAWPHDGVPSSESAESCE